MVKEHIHLKMEEKTSVNIKMIKSGTQNITTNLEITLVLGLMEFGETNEQIKSDIIPHIPTTYSSLFARYRCARWELHHNQRMSDL